MLGFDPMWETMVATHAGSILLAAQVLVTSPISHPHLPDISHIFFHISPRYLPLYLAYISAGARRPLPIHQPLHLPYISPISRLCLAHISPHFPTPP